MSSVFFLAILGVFKNVHVSRWLIKYTEFRVFDFQQCYFFSLWAKLTPAQGIKCDRRKSDFAKYQRVSQKISVFTLFLTEGKTRYGISHNAIIQVVKGGIFSLQHFGKQSKECL